MSATACAGSIPQACYAHPLDGGRALALYRDVGRTAAGLDAAGAGDGERWARFVQPMLDEFEAIRATMLGGFPPVGGGLRLVGSLGPLGALGFGRLLPGSAEGLGKRLFHSAAARAWLYGSAGHGDVPPTGAGSAIAVAYLNLLGHAVGWPSPRGGAERLTDALVAHLPSWAARCAPARRWTRSTAAPGASAACGSPGASASRRRSWSPT